MGAPIHFREPWHDAAEPDLSGRDQGLVAIAIAAVVAFVLVGFGAGYLAAPSPLDAPAPRCATHAER